MAWPLTTHCLLRNRVIVSAEKKKEEEKKAAASKPQRRGNKVIEDSSEDEEVIVGKKPPPSDIIEKADAMAGEAGPSSKAVEDSAPHATPSSQPPQPSPRPASQKKGQKQSTGKKILLKDDQLNADEPIPLDDNGTQADPATGTQQLHQQGASQPSLRPKGDLMLMMPDKLPSNKVLIELNPAATDAHSKGTMELAGDAGSVGRIVIDKGAGMASGQEGGPSFQIDLKGVLYDAQVIPLNGTAMILNIGIDQAKVEAVMHDFVRLKQDPSSFVYNNEDGGMNFGSDDDDEGHYALGEVGGEGEGGEGQEGVKKTKVKKTTAAGMSTGTEKKKA